VSHADFIYAERITVKEAVSLADERATIRQFEENRKQSRKRLTLDTVKAKRHTYRHGVIRDHCVGKHLLSCSLFDSGHHAIEQALRGLIPRSARARYKAALRFL
jgi:hypothetical protein